MKQVNKNIHNAEKVSPWDIGFKGNSGVKRNKGNNKIFSTFVGYCAKCSIFPYC